jgi:hypothetical protein
MQVLIVLRGHRGFTYDNDYHANELPFWQMVQGKLHLSSPAR